MSSVWIQEVLLPLAGLVVAFIVGCTPILWAAWKGRRGHE